MDRNGGCWDDLGWSLLVMTGIIPENSLRLAPVYIYIYIYVDLTQPKLTRCCGGTPTNKHCLHLGHQLNKNNFYCNVQTLVTDSSSPQIRDGVLRKLLVFPATLPYFRSCFWLTSSDAWDKEATLLIGCLLISASITIRSWTLATR